jgi:mRNA-degrading endonuclease RelE of RelBE toxin-antitoxin system
MRTTIDIDEPILKELKRLQKEEKKSLGRLISDLLAEALGQRRRAPQRRPPFRWISRSMRARVDLEDHDVVLDAMDDRRA